MQPATRGAYRLFTEGLLALAKIEAVGLPVSAEKLKIADTEIRGQIRELEAKLREHPIYAMQRNRFHKDANLGSREQLASVLYGDLRLPGATKSKNGKFKLDEDILDGILETPDLDESVRDYLTQFTTLQKRNKLQSTYLTALSREVQNGRVHSFINLHIPTTYRGSVDSPNLNNLPTRNKLIAKYIKGAVCPRPGNVIVEIDYSALEVHIAACYHKDPTMLQYLESGYDMHSDMAAECFMLDKAWKQANPTTAKELRTWTKNLFVFASFYGDYYASIALNLWNRGLRIPAARARFVEKGITAPGVYRDPSTGKIIESTEPGTYVKHIKNVESDFWNKRFGVYNAWRRDWWSRYKSKGYFHTKTGFRVHGVWKRNEVINNPVQGSAFHCLLQSIIDIQKEIEQRRMGSRVIMEIHDSILAEVPEHEVEEYVEMATEVMTHRLRAKWPWICLDLKVEVEIGRESWFDKISYEEWKTGK